MHTNHCYGFVVVVVVVGTHAKVDTFNLFDVVD
jgi:hypothetical protein